MTFTKNAEDNIRILKFLLKADESFDIVYRTLQINNRTSGIFFIDGLVNLWGLIGGFIFVIILIITNRTISGKSYLYPLIPFDSKKFFNKVIRTRLR